MRLAERFWTSVTYVVSFFTFSPESRLGEVQTPLRVFPYVHEAVQGGPNFKPPGGRLEGPGSDFNCSYPRLTGYEPCFTPENQTCWLRNNETGHAYTINTNYEDSNQTPFGIHRTYYLNVTNGTINADGLNFTEGKMFNASYPGPWLQACWGDYGSSWYHSHYAVQYADGVLGPLTLHGPSSDAYEEAKTSLLMTDWGHNSAFEAIWRSSGGLKLPSILLNGAGNVTRYNNKVPTKPEDVPKTYTIHFEPPDPPRGRPKRYLLRLIISFDSTFIFSIDNHVLKVVASDFVPIKPYTTTSVLVGIGQRYHVIVEARPLPNDGDPPPSDGNFWIRTWKADCFGFNQNLASPGYEKTGLLRYHESDSYPTSSAWQGIPFRCSDEDYINLQPVLRWNVSKPRVNDRYGGVGENFTVQLRPSPEIFPLALFSIGGDEFNHLRIDYGDPTFLHLNYTGKWNPLAVVVPEDYTDSSWVYLVLKGRPGNTFGAHPIHLHGHDFAILQQIENPNFPEQLSLKYDNPPRRDVVLLPNNDYAVIAFKTDNPGIWLMHRHIAFHASFGLAMQILERRQAAADIWPNFKKSDALRQAQRGCDNWNAWWGNCKNWWPGEGKSCGIGDSGFAPDSGI